MNVLLSLTCLLLSLSGALLVRAAYPPTFNNHTGCLYTHLNPATSMYRVTFQEAAEKVREAPLKQVAYDSGTTCLDAATGLGKLIMNFETSDDYFTSMSLEMQLKSTPLHRTWEVKQATLTIVPVNGAQYPKTKIELRSTSGDIYAAEDRSYSCSELTLVNVLPAWPQFRLTLKRFQLQPFHEPATTVFAASRDCSTFLTMPQIMGLLLVLFMIFTVLIGVYLLLDLGGHSGDIRFSKQGGMLMNQAQLDATKAD